RRDLIQTRRPLPNIRHPNIVTHHQGLTRPAPRNPENTPINHHINVTVVLGAKGTYPRSPCTPLARTPVESVADAITGLGHSLSASFAVEILDAAIELHLPGLRLL